MKSGEEMQDRFMLKPLAIAFAAALTAACGGGGGGGGDGSGDGDGGGGSGDGGGGSALTSAQQEALATTSATQLTGLATGARTAAEQASQIDSGDDLDGLLDFGLGSTSAFTPSLNSMDAITHSSHDRCSNDGSFSDEDLTDPTGVRVTANNCQITDEGAEGVTLDLTLDGTLETTSAVNSDGDTESNFDSDFSATLAEFSLDEITDSEGNTVLPAIGPITGNFSSVGGYEATIGTSDGTANNFEMNADSWDLGFGLSCDGQGFDFEFGTDGVTVTSNRDETNTGWETEINGTIAWAIDADVWDSEIDEELTYTTEEPIFTPDTGSEPTAGRLRIAVAGGEEVTVEYEDGGVSVNGTSFTYDELSDRHEDELGADLEESVLGSCGGFGSTS